MWLTNDWIRAECHPMGGKIASPSLLLAPQHILSSSVSWVALFLSDVSLSVKSFSYISSSLAISHPSTFLISYFLHDTTPFISLIQSGLHSCFTQVKADIFFSSMLENLFDVEPQHVCKSGTTFIKPYATKRLLVCGYSEHKYLSLCR